MAKLNMPKNRKLRRQAAQIVNAGLPSKGSLKRQYGTAIQDAGDFSKALVELLRGQGAGGQAYAEAADQQRGINDAARQELGQLGPEFAGAATTVGAAGDSALSRLLAGGAAEKSFAARQPGIAASRGALAQTGLENALQEALTQRQEQFRAGFGPALQQVTQNAQSRSLALSQLGLSERQLGLSERSLALQEQSQAFQESQALASAKGAAAEAARSEQKWRAEFIAKYNFDPYTGKAVRTPGSGGASAAPPGFTTTQWRSALRDAAEILSPGPVSVYDENLGRNVQKPQRDFAQQGMDFRDAIQTLVSKHGMAPLAARTAVIRLYRTYAGAPRNSPAWDAWASYFRWITRAMKDPRNTGPH